MKKILPKLLLICLIFTGCAVTDDTTPEGVFRIVKKAAEEKDERTFARYYYFSSDGERINFMAVGFRLLQRRELEFDYVKIKKIKKIQTSHDENTIQLEVEYKVEGQSGKTEPYKYSFYKDNGQWKIGKLFGF